jgi:hypothetical protein
MAEALRAFPDLMIFAQLDAASVARRLLFAAGFDEDDIDRLWRAALEAELARRLVETALTSLTPVHHSEALDDDALISAMAQTLRPFRNIDIDGFARLALLRSGFDRPATDRHWRAAQSAELAHRRAFPFKKLGAAEANRAKIRATMDDLTAKTKLAERLSPAQSEMGQ